MSCLCLSLKAAHVLSDQTQGAATLFTFTAVHCGALRKTNMAAACVRALCKVGRCFLETPVVSRSSLPGHVSGHGSRRAYGTGGPGFRSRLLSAARAGGGRALGCAFLLGGGLGLYQTLKLTAEQHLAQEDRDVSPDSVDQNPVSVLVWGDV